MIRAILSLCLSLSSSLIVSWRLRFGIATCKNYCVGFGGIRDTNFALVWIVDSAVNSLTSAELSWSSTYWSLGIVSGTRSSMMGARQLPVFTGAGTAGSTAIGSAAAIFSGVIVSEAVIVFLRGLPTGRLGGSLFDVITLRFKGVLPHFSFFEKVTLWC